MRCNKPIDINIKKGNIILRTEKVRCGKCLACRITKVQIWSLRLLFEYATRGGNGRWITLTYNNESLKTLFDSVDLPENYETPPTLDHKDVQKYIKRIRKNTKAKFSYFCCGEYGGNFGRPHYHLLVFGDIMPWESFKDEWKLGTTYEGTITTASIRYTLKYMMKDAKDQHKLGKQKPPYIACSKGLGEAGICMDFEKVAEQGYIRNQEGAKVPVPTYFKRKYPEIFKSEFFEDAELNTNYNIGIPVHFNGSLNYDQMTDEQSKKLLEASKIELDKARQRELNLESKEYYNDLLHGKEEIF